MLIRSTTQLMYLASSLAVIKAALNVWHSLCNWQNGSVHVPQSCCPDTVKVVN